MKPISLETKNRTGHSLSCQNLLYCCFNSQNKKVAENKGEEEKSDVAKPSQWTFASKRRKAERARGHKSTCN